MVVISSLKSEELVLVSGNERSFNQRKADRVTEKMNALQVHRQEFAIWQTTDCVGSTRYGFRKVNAKAAHAPNINL
jgi:hypothetical protein